MNSTLNLILVICPLELEHIVTHLLVICWGFWKTHTSFYASASKRYLNESANVVVLISILSNIFSRVLAHSLQKEMSTWTKSVHKHILPHHSCWRKHLDSSKGDWESVYTLSLPYIEPFVDVGNSNVTTNTTTTAKIVSGHNFKGNANASCMLGKHCTNWGLFPALSPIFWLKVFRTWE